MAAGFLITRILLVCLLSELNYPSAFPTANPGYSNAWKDGEKQDMQGYRTRRPLDYIRALRQHNRNPQLNERAQIRQKPLGSLRDLINSQIKGTVNPHQPKEVSPLRPTPRTNYSSVKPKSFQVHLNVPLLDLLGQNERSESSTKGSGYGNYGPDMQPYRQSSVQIQSGVNSPVSNILGNQYPTKYDSEGKNGHSVSKPSFQLDFSVPFPDKSVKSSEGHGHFLNLKPGGTLAQNRYMGPVKTQLSSTKTGSEWQPWLHTGTVHGQEPQEMESKWSILSHTGSGHRTQHKPIYTQPTDDKLSVSSWYSSQHGNPQIVSQDKTLTGHSWGFQEPGTDKFQSLPISKYPEHPLVFISHTSSPREDDGADQGVHPDPTKFQFPWLPQQYNRIPSRGSGLYSEKNIAPPTSGPSRVNIQSGILVPGSDLSSKGSTKNPNEGKPDQNASKQSIHLTLTVPIPNKSVDHIKNGSGHLVNIKPITTGSVGDYMLPTKLQSSFTQTGLKWPSSHHTGHEQTLWQTHEPFHAKPAEKLILSSWHSSQDTTPSDLSWEFEKLGMTKFPSLPISKYPEHAEVHGAHLSLPKKDYKDPTVLHEPFQGVSRPFYSAQAKPYGNGFVQRPINHSVGSSLSFTPESHDYDRFKPSDRTKHVETTHSRPLIQIDFPSSGSHFEVASTSRDARKGQKPVSSPYQYSRRTEASHDRDASNAFPNSPTLSTAYHSQKTLPRQDAGRHKQDEKEKFTGLFINLEGGGDGIAGKTYFAAETPYMHGYTGKWIGKNTAGAAINSNPHVNLQAQVSVKDSLKELLESSIPNKKPQSYVQSEQYNTRYQFPERVSYSPGAQRNAASVPKNTQLYFSGGLQPLQDAF